MQKPQVTFRRPPPAPAIEAFVRGETLDVQAPRAPDIRVLEAPPVESHPAGEMASPSKIQPSSHRNGRKSRAPDIQTSKRTVVQRRDGRTLHRTTVYMSPELSKRVGRYCFDAEIDLSEVVGRALEEYLERTGGR